MNRQQKGVSLISLLIGLLVSMIVIVGMLMIYRNTIHVVVPASEAARSDGERVAGLLAAHMMLVDAGFGVENEIYGTHLQVLNGNSPQALATTVDSKASGDTVVWIKKLGDDSFCEGLQANKDMAGDLWRVSCNATTLTGITPVAPMILPSRHTGDEVSGITITASREECRPFGIGTNIVGGITLTLTLETTTTKALGKNIQSTTCLVNFLP